MKSERLVLDYGRLSEAHLKLNAENVITSLTGNANFPQTRPTLENFTALEIAYASALEKAMGGDRVKIALKNQAKADLLAGMRTLATDINVQANGDKAMLLSSGLTLASQAEPITSLETPSELKLMDGTNPGELRISCKRVPGAINYSFECATEMLNGSTQWRSEVDSSREHLFKNLPSGTRIYIRIKAFGHRGLVSISDVQSRVVQ